MMDIGCGRQKWRRLGDSGIGMENQHTSVATTTCSARWYQIPDSKKAAALLERA
jgi:hypothetical protein